MSDTLCVRNLSVSVGEFRVEDVSLTVEAGEMFVIVGPSGAGKTVLLEAIGGFHKPQSGRIAIEGVDVTDLPAHQRGVALVFQDYALFPHLRVRENILFGARYQEGNYDQARLQAIIELLGISGLLDRWPARLSGVEQQRVALARALLLKPKLLLADEPFAALDVPLRERLRMEFLKTVHRLKQAVLFVTHNRTEAYQLATKMAVMKDGRIIQKGTPEQVYYQPSDTQVAEFVGVETLLDGVVSRAQDGLLEVDVGDAEVVATGQRPVGAEVTVCIRADIVALDRGVSWDTSSIRNHFTGVVSTVNLVGPLAYVSVDCGFMIKAAITRLSLEELGISPGSEVGVSFKAVAAHVV